MLDSDTAKDLIKPHMAVVCSENGRLAEVDHVEGRNAILLKDDSGQPHYIPLTWVSSVDDKVHLNRPGSEVKRDWSATPPRS